MTKVKIAIVDDHKLYRETLKLLIEKLNACKIISEASNGEEFLMQLDKIVPDIVFMDVKMPIMNGIIATKEALKIHPKMKVIGLSMLEDQEYIDQIKKAGAISYLKKDQGEKEFRRLIMNIIDNTKHLSRYVK